MTFQCHLRLLFVRADDLELVGLEGVDLGAERVLGRAGHEVLDLEGALLAELAALRTRRAGS